MTDRNKKEDRWASLAEDLGLEDEPRPRQQERSPSPPPPPPPPDELPWSETTHSEESDHLEPPVPFHREPELVEEAMEVGEEPAGETEEIDSAEEPGAGGEEGGKRRRRRRRRRRKGGPEGDEPREAATQPVRKPLDIKPVQPPRKRDAGREEPRDVADRSRRGRGDRRERKAADPIAEDADEMLMETASQPVDSGDDDVEPPTDLSEWNVPSWNELIAALYRPPDR